jgi:hypothetical protein
MKLADLLLALGAGDHHHMKPVQPSIADLLGAGPAWRGATPGEILSSPSPTRSPPHPAGFASPKGQRP